MRNQLTDFGNGDELNFDDMLRRQESGEDQIGFHLFESDGNHRGGRSDPLRKRVLQSERIFHQDDEQDENLVFRQAQPHFSETQTNLRLDTASSNIAEQGSNYVRDSTKLKRNGQQQMNSCATKNYISFLWKKICKVMKSKPQVNNSQWWNNLNKIKPSLELLSRLFAQQDADIHLRKMFDNRYFLREIMYSSIDSHKKKIYISYIRRVYQGFLRGQIKYLK